MMKRTLTWIAVIVVAALVLIPPVFGKKFEYPQTKKVVVTDDYHGTKIDDPYRWLEDDYAEDTGAWVEAQGKVTFDYLQNLPQRKKINERLKAMWNYERYSLPFKKGEYYIYSRNDGLQNQSVNYIQKGLTGEPRVLLDPNTFSEDGTVIFTGGELSEDTRYFMYGVSEGGSDWRTMRVREVKTGKDMNDEIRWIKFANATWSKDGKGFYYSRYPAPEEGKALVEKNVRHKICYHSLGAPQSSDELIFEDPDNPNRLFFSGVSEDGAYLIIYALMGSDRRNGLYYKPIGAKSSGDVVRLLDDFDASYGFVGNDGGVFYFQTDLDAPKSRLIAVDTSKPDRKNWREIIPEQEDVLQATGIIGGKFVTVYLHDASNQIRVYEKNGDFIGNVPLPGIGTVAGISGKEDNPEMFFSFNSFSYPTTSFRYDLNSRKIEVFQKPETGIDPENYITEQVFFSSKDGTRVPMFLTYRKDALKKGNTPTYLYGYGGFGVTLTPYFDVSNLLWMEMGGIYALVNLRGGGEYGEEWHEAGMFEKRQNVYDDFISAAEHLIDAGYTNTKKMVISGASNGGLLVGACMVQRPDLFAVALPDVGVFDMLRYHLFTIGWAWASDYGRSDNPDHFPFLLTQSPYHNLKEGVAYPATLITTADHDDRVVPAHSFKFAAKLQECHAGDAPVLIRIETKAGHGGISGIDKRIELVTDQLAFTAENLKMKF
jgi:prolyl oligopeptidase